MALADRIQQRLDVLTMNQAELARRSGVKPASVNNWLSGKTQTLKGENLLRAAMALQCNPRWLSSGIGASTPDNGSTAVIANESRPNWGQPRDDDAIEEALAILRRLEPEARLDALQWLRGFAAGRKKGSAQKRGSDPLPGAAAA
jgi:transcriptional regulator with XRE-family HTH domain